jgi:hypothetical protein
MKQNENIYTAEAGNFIIRKADGFIMGEEIDLGSADSIENYEEKPYTEEERKAFYESIGMESPKERESKNKPEEE